MIYVDTSVVLAAVFAEDRSPAPDFWTQALVTSRLLECEVWTRVHASRASRAVIDYATAILQRLSFVEMNGVTLARTREPWPVHVRTLDAIHLAAIEFLRNHHQDVQLASYDTRLNACAEKLGILVVEI